MIQDFGLKVQTSDNQKKSFAFLMPFIT